MRKVIWVCWCLLLLAFATSYFRSAACDVQLTHTLWLQAATADGGARFVVLRGDPSASWTANTVIERDKSTWRYGRSRASRSQVRFNKATVDSLGTVVDTVRIDISLLALLLIPTGLLLGGWAMKRWGAPPRLVWAELSTFPRFGRGVFGKIRRLLLVVSILLAFATGFLWVASYIVIPPSWRHFGDHFALAETKETDTFGFAFHLNSPDGVGQQLSRYVGNHLDQLQRPKRHFSIEVLHERIAFHYYTGPRRTRTTFTYTRAGMAGIELRKQYVPAPSIMLDWPLGLFMRPDIPLGVERTLELPFWALLILFGLWPLWCFIRGPVRRARRRAAGCCPPCGYNLTGLSATRCPECGTAFDPQSIAWTGRPTC